MPNLAINPVNVMPTDSTLLSEFIARILTPGGVINAGQLVYFDNDLQGVALADADAMKSAQIAGMALCTAYNYQPLVLAVGGEVDLGAILIASTSYVASTSAGQIMPLADLTPGKYTAVVGVANSSSRLKLALMASQVARV